MGTNPKNPNDAKDPRRMERIRRAMQEHQLDGLVCALPSNVLLLSGYWPVVGASFAVMSRDRLGLVVPADEKEMASRGRADDVRTFEAGSLDRLTGLLDVVRQPLKEVLASLGLERGRVGYEGEQWVQAAPYVASHHFGPAVRELLSELAPQASLYTAKSLLEPLRMRLTPRELEMTRLACGLVRAAFEEGVAHLMPGLPEHQAAAIFRGPLMAGDDDHRADGFVYCMSGPNAAEAYAAYQRSRARPLQPADLVLMHCNSYVGGFWTDVTRTYCQGEPTDRQRRMYEAVLAARDAALHEVRPGAMARDVDHAARHVMEQYGFGKQFVHPTGHGVGFAAIDHNAKPRLHPRSPDVLEEGMVFNIEPAAYFPGECGMRHCDMVTVTVEGAQVLTPFHSRIDELLLPIRGRT